MNNLKESTLAFFHRLGFKSTPDESVWTFDPTEPARVIKFVESFCRHFQGACAGKQFKLLPWQVELVATLYGWRDKDGHRKYKKLYLQVARKAGKTILLSALALYHLLVDRSDGLQEIILAAGSRDQAKLALKDIQEFVKADKYLAKEVNIYRNSVNCKQDSSVLKCISADGGVAHGLNVSVGLIDELHVHKKKELYEAIVTSVGARKNYLLAVMTTAGADQNTVCYDLYVYARQVRDDIVSDDHFLPAVYELAPEDDWKNEDFWVKANPSLGHSNNIEFLRSELKVALAQPSYENSFKQLYLNQWVTGAANWLGLDKWTACERANLDWEQIRKLPCWIGVDLSSVSDTTAISLIYKDEEKEVCYAESIVYWPQRGFEKARLRENKPLLVWKNQGYLRITDGEVVHAEGIQNEISELIKSRDVRCVIFDPANAVSIMSNLQIAHPQTPIIQVYQGFAQISPKVMATQAAIYNKTLLHSPNPVTDWQITNCVAKYNGNGEVKLEKALARNKIDAIVALVMAYGAMNEHLGEDEVSRYSGDPSEFSF